MRDKLFTVLTILAAAVFLGTAAHPRRLKIGVAGPLPAIKRRSRDAKTGANASGRGMERQGRVKVGKKKMKVDILWGDDRHDPREGVSIAHKFVNSGAAGIVGHFNSSVSIPASTVYAEAGVVQITPASTNPKLTEQGFSTVFRVCGRDDQQGEVAAKYIVDKLKLKRIASSTTKPPTGRTGRGAKRSWRKDVQARLLQRGRAGG